MNYLKTAFRSQAKSKWLAIVNVSGLCLGITCALLIFLYVEGHFKTDTFHEDSERIYRVVLNIQTPTGSVEYDAASALPVGRALREEYSSIDINAYCMRFYSAPTISISHGLSIERFKEEKIIAYADNHFVRLFQHDFLEGDKERVLVEPRTAIISEKQALKYFGTTQAVGKVININNTLDVMITGVFKDHRKSSDLKFEVLVSLPTLKVLNPGYNDHNFSWIGSNNWTFVKLNARNHAADLEALLPSFVEKYLGPNFRHWTLRLQPLAEIHFDTRYDGQINKGVLWILLAVAIGLIVIVSINFVNLSIAQASRRSKEIGLRKYLGANRQQLFWQFLSETFVWVGLSGFISICLVYSLLPFINSWLHLDLDIQQFLSGSSATYMLLFIGGLSLLAGYYPASVLSGFNPINAIAGRGIGGTRSYNLRMALIAFQYTVALIFMISSFVIFSQVNYLLTSDAGFERKAIVTVNLPKRNYSVLQSFSNALAAVPGIESVAMHHEGPMSTAVDGGFVRYDNRSEFEDFIVRDRWGDENFARTYGLEFIAGRNIIMHDSLTEVLVNESFVRRLSLKHPSDALGRPVTFNNSEVNGKIVGIIKDFHNRSLQNEIEPLAIYPVRRLFNQLAVKVASSSNVAVINEVQRKWTAMFPDEVFQFSFLDQELFEMYQVERVTSHIMRVFAILAFVISLMGIFGISVYELQLRKREIGIRKVLGANALTIIAMQCRKYVFLVAVAIAMAVPLSLLFVSDWLNNFAYHIELTWLFFAIPPVVIVTITLVLVGIQSLQAATANPVESLKYE